MLNAGDFFDLSATDHQELFAGTQFVWEAIEKIERYIAKRLADDLQPNADRYKQLPGVYFANDKVYIGEGTVIEPGAFIEGPAIIGRNCMLRHNAFIRANTILGDEVGVGNSSEVKNALMLNGSHAPHFNYVGDSLLGARVNLGAGTKLSNLAVSSAKDPVTGKRPTIHLIIDGEEYDLGLAKMGAILGDDVQTGCNSVTNPGTIIGPRTMVYPLVSVRKGYYGPDRIIKLRQSVEIVERQT